jgi:hypothetical protein
MQFLLILILSLSFQIVLGQKQTAKSNMSIQGRWISLGDKKYTVFFTGTSRIELYEKKLTNKASYKIKGDSLIVVDSNRKDTIYYSIMGLDRRNLTLMYLTRGNLLRFTGYDK